MRSRLACLLVAFAATTSVAAEQQLPSQELASLLHRIGQRVEIYLARAQSLVCIETVRLQPLSAGLTADGFGRHVESELRVSWDASSDPTAISEARTLRQVLKVNGHAPRAKDRDNCTAPEQNDTEPHYLSMLLPEERADYTFTIVGPGRMERRPAILLDFRLRSAATVEVHEIEGREDCISFSVNGGMRGRLWIDALTYDVLRLDQGLAGLVTIPLPKKVARQPGTEREWTMERWDTSVRFKAVAFADPDETLMLPRSVSSLRITRGGGTPRLRTTTEYSGYKRFVTGARLVVKD